MQNPMALCIPGLILLLNVLFIYIHLIVSVLVPEGKKKPMARALYDFVPENEGELSFQEGELIDLISQVSIVIMCPIRT